jgi:hypothetical protein
MSEWNPFENVRQSCRAVMDRASKVAIDPQPLVHYVHDLAAVAVSPEHDPKAHYLGQGSETVAFFITLDTINFGSGYFPHLRKLAGKSGYFTVATWLAEHFRVRGALSANQLSELSAADCAAMFHQAGDDPAVAELMTLFAQALNDLGRLLRDSYQGSFTTLVEAAEESAANLVRQLATMPFFRDVQEHAGRPVAFYKRAQLAAADLALAFQGSSWGRFEDLSQLTIFADNLVPHVLRVDGILRYSSDLAQRIDAGVSIPADSAEEVELRAGAVTAAEMIVEQARRQGLAWTAMEVDYRLWNRGQLPRYKQAKPRHRTRTVYY